MLFSIFQSDSHGADILRHTSLHANWMLMRSAARKLHLAAVERNRCASCGRSSGSPSSTSFVLPTTSLPLHSFVLHLLQDQFNVPRVGLDVHTMFLPLDGPAQHHNRLIVRDLRAQGCPNLGLVLFTDGLLEFLSSASRDRQPQNRRHG